MGRGGPLRRRRRAVRRGEAGRGGAQDGVMAAQARTADVRTAVSCELLELHAEDLWQVTRRRPPRDGRRTAVGP